MNTQEKVAILLMESIICTNIVY